MITNGDGGCGWYQPFIGELTAQVGWLGLRVGGHPALSLHSSNEPGELYSIGFSHYNSTINIGVCIIVDNLAEIGTKTDV